MFRQIFGMFLILLAFDSVAEARVILKGFENHSSIKFQDRFEDGYFFRDQLDRGILLDQEPATIWTEDGCCAISLRDMGRSSFWSSCEVYIQREQSFPYGKMEDYPYATIHYEGDGEFEIKIHENGYLEVIPGYHISWVQYRTDRLLALYLIEQ